MNLPHQMTQNGNFCFGYKLEAYGSSKAKGRKVFHMGKEHVAHQTELWGNRNRSTRRKLDAGLRLALSLPQLMAAPSCLSP